MSDMAALHWLTRYDQCPVCRRTVRVNMDGRLRKHKAVLQTYRRFGVWCWNQSPNASRREEQP